MGERQIPPGQAEVRAEAERRESRRKSGGKKIDYFSSMNTNTTAPNPLFLWSFLRVVFSFLALRGGAVGIGIGFSSAFRPSSFGNVAAQAGGS